MKVSRLQSVAAAFLCAAMLSACGGHSGGVLPSQSRTTQPRGGDAQATLVVKIPSASRSARHPAYISASTQSISFTYNIGTTLYPAQTLNVTPASPGCSKDAGGNTVCSLTFGAAAGSANYTVTAYDGLNGAGNVLSTAQSTMQIVAGQDNKFNLTLDGVAASFGLSLTGADATGAIPAGTKASVGLDVSAYDADNNLIVNSPALTSAAGTTLTAATLNLAPDNGEFAVSQNGKTLTASGAGYQLTAPFTGVSISYNGGRMADLALTLGAGSLSAQTVLHVEPVLTTYTVQATYPAIADLAPGSDGNVWFTDGPNNAVGRITPSGSIIEYPAQAAGAAPYRMTTDSAGTIWLTEGGTGCACIARLSMDGSIAATYPAYENGCQPYPGAIGVDSNENVWYTNAACSLIGYINMNSGTGSSFGGNTDDTDMAVTPDGRAWTIEAPQIVSRDLAGNVTAYTTQANGALTVTAGSGGKLWFSDSSGSANSYIGYLDTSTNKIVNEYPIPRQPDGYYPYAHALTAGPDGTVWFSFDDLYAQPNVGHDFGYVDPVSGKVTLLTLYGNPSLAKTTGHLIVGPDGNVWFVNYETPDGRNEDTIGKITIGS